MDVQGIRAITEAVRGEVRKAIVGQDDDIDLMLTSLLAGGHILLEGVPGTAKTLLAQCFAPRLALRFRPHPVHARPDARRRPRAPTCSTSRPTTFILTKGPDLHRAAARRRDQPHAAEDAGGAAGGDEERVVTIDGEDHPLGDALHGDRDAEPDRAAGHLSAAGGAARSLPLQDRDRLSRAATRSARSCAATAIAPAMPRLDDFGSRGGRRRARCCARCATPSPDPPVRRSRSTTSSTSCAPPAEHASFEFGRLAARRHHAGHRVARPGGAGRAATS